ncbi:hypothetical protein DF3PB_20079 [uncultured Defluviicoccus sp.]|uniref:Uncharacterized protein n=1 Tax=metagenome TaxID=256318 RepID=A0A380TDG4_9ZZZZ|nr:hypothetical protein DF3PB_20079 [uncultured Defluviicoccus sp.]
MSILPGVLRQPRLHPGYFFLLCGDDLLGELADFWIPAVLEDDLSHVDRSLVVRDHPGDEVAIGVAGESDHHVAVHLFVCSLIRRDHRVGGTGPVVAVRWASGRARHVFVLHRHGAAAGLGGRVTGNGPTDHEACWEGDHEAKKIVRHCGQHRFVP